MEVAEWDPAERLETVVEAQFLTAQRTARLPLLAVAADPSES